MSHRLRRSCPWFVLTLAGCAALGILFDSSVSAQQTTESPIIPREDVKACLECHQAAMSDTVNAVNADALKRSPHKDLACQDCHSTVTAAPHTPEMLKVKAACGDCHTEEAAAYASGVHARPDKKAGDHATCVTCHGGGDPHAVQSAAAWTRADKAKVCSDCHAEEERMGRYGVDADAVPSYNESFHGKALLRFNKEDAATCTDCHKSHDVMQATNPASPTNRKNVTRTCAACHKGANINFAMSGASHLGMKIKQTPILHAEELFFQWLTTGTMILLLAGVGLDLRRRTLGRGPEPLSGRFVGLLVSVSYLFMVLGLAMAWLGFGYPHIFGIVAVGLLVFALLAYLLKPRKPVEAPSGRNYVRITVSQRWQHALLGISFTLLVLTGLPVRFFQVDWLRDFYVLLGGMGILRVVHRVAAAVMIFTWIWHTLYLLYQWKKAGFRLNSWTMFPNRKDVADFFAVCLYYLGVTKEEPKYDRFQFREKFDYFAVYWGMPVMVLSGFLLWFPVTLGNRLPEISLAAAYIAHSDEAILAFLAIATWHLYNVHFNPDRFPMSKVFYTGTMTEEEMRREHPLELDRLKNDGNPGSPAETE